MFILVANRRLSKQDWSKGQKHKIQRFSTLPFEFLHYTNSKSVFDPTQVGMDGIADCLGIRNKSFLYVSTASQQELLFIKLSAINSFRIFNINADFLQDQLPVLDAMLLSVSDNNSVELDEWIPHEDKEHWQKLMCKWEKSFQCDVRLFIKKAASCYRKNAFWALREAEIQKRLIERKSTSTKIELMRVTRFAIAKIIREKFIRENISTGNVDSFSSLYKNAHNVSLAQSA